jgi:hypothetical protein
VVARLLADNIILRDIVGKSMVKFGVMTLAGDNRDNHTDDETVNALPGHCLYI